MKKLLLLGTLGATLAFGSATVAKGINQPISFNSSPEGATVMIDGNVKCKTPCSVTLAKNEYTNITFQKEGYESKDMTLGKKFDGVAILNILWDLSTTDLITGAIYEYSPDNYFVEMKKSN